MEVHLTTPQSDFFRLEATFPLFVGGFGSGKTQTLCARAMQDMFEFPGADIAIYAPTYDLLRLSTIPRIAELLESMPVNYHYNRADNIMTVQGYGRFIFRSLDNPARIVAYEVYRSHIDELDTMRKEKAEDAWNRVISRNRQKLPGGSNRVCAYTTPEGYNFAYERWARRPGEGYKLVRASTRSNPFLPPDYIDNLMATYPAQLVEAYIDGRFVNLRRGNAFPHFDRALNESDAEPEDFERLHIGMDFNVDHMCAVVWGIKNRREAHAVGEFVDHADTPAMIEALLSRFGAKTDRGSRRWALTAYPDASGRSRSSRSSTESDITMLRQAGLAIDAPNANPLIRDRVASTNAMICNGVGDRKLLINPDLCPTLCEAFETIAWTESGDWPKSSSGIDLTHIIDAATYPIDRLFTLRRTAAASTSTFEV
tara:strand:- start:2655 stop:3932 length:1278 start_codon:yes stop_codon:yes gene_type:complete